MSSRDRNGLDPEDLIARARRGLSSRDERAALEQATALSPVLALDAQLGDDVDRAAAVRAGDETLIARAADAALARASVLPPSARRGGWRVPGARMLAAAVLVLAVVSGTGMAAALWSGIVPRWPFTPEPEAQPSSEPARSERAAKHRPKPARPVPVVAPAPIVPPVIEPSAPVTDAPNARERRRVAPSAAELFHDANAARRSGDFGRARRLYASLIESHEGSDEAGLSRVSLGKLLLAAGEAQAAEREFRRYLAAGPGQLAEEALVGQAQSLGRLQRTNEERAAWQRLLRAHPQSVYATQARQRLLALDSDRDAPR